MKSGGTASYIDDNVHVRGPLVKRVTDWMVERYAAAQPTGGDGVAPPE